MRREFELKQRYFLKQLVKVSFFHLYLTVALKLEKIKVQDPDCGELKYFAELVPRKAANELCRRFLVL